MRSEGILPTASFVLLCLAVLVGCLFLSSPPVLAGSYTACRDKTKQGEDLWDEAYRKGSAAIAAQATSVLQQAAEACLACEVEQWEASAAIGRRPEAGGFAAEAASNQEWIEDLIRGIGQWSFTSCETRRSNLAWLDGFIERLRKHERIVGTSIRVDYEFTRKLLSRFYTERGCSGSSPSEESEKRPSYPKPPDSPQQPQPPTAPGTGPTLQPEVSHHSYFVNFSAPDSWPTYGPTQHTTSWIARGRYNISTDAPFVSAGSPFGEFSNFELDVDIYPPLATSHESDLYRYGIEFRRTKYGNMYQCSLKRIYYNGRHTWYLYTTILERYEVAPLYSDPIGWLPVNPEEIHLRVAARGHSFACVVDNRLVRIFVDGRYPQGSIALFMQRPRGVSALGSDTVHVEFDNVYILGTKAAAAKPPGTTPAEARPSTSTPYSPNLSSRTERSSYSPSSAPLSGSTALLNLFLAVLITAVIVAAINYVGSFL